MILIEGHWEMVKSLHDIPKIVREYYNPELADELDELIKVQEDEIKRLEELINEFNELDLESAADINILLDEIDDLECSIRSLKRRIAELEDC